MKLKPLIFIIILLVILTAAGLISYKRQNSRAGEKMQITATFYPLAEFARQIGKDKIDVKTLIPEGTEPHEFEPAPRDRIILQQSKIFILNGAGLEPWSNRVLPDLKNTIALDASKEVLLLPASPSGKENKNSARDPHFWLDPLIARKIIDNIEEKFSEADPKNASFYKENAADYSKKLLYLDAEFRRKLSNCEKKDIITSHAAFAYLSKEYGFNQIPIAGLSEEEPSAERIAEVSRLAKEKNIKYIFFETLVNPRLTETIAKESGAKILALNPIEGLTREEEKQNENYISIMEKNLENLKTALNCHE